MARKSIAPWSERVSEGLIDQPIDSQISASQTLRATVDTGFIDQTGTWKGIVSSDADFGFYHKGTAVGNGEVDLASTCDMTGFNDIQIAIKPSNGGNFAIQAVMGPDTNTYGGLSPVNAASFLRGNIEGTATTMSSFTNVLADAAESLTVDVWNIFYIRTVLKDQKLLQFKITNNTGGSSDIEIMYLRIV
jgi:hypothetical protein